MQLYITVGLIVVTIVMLSFDKWPPVSAAMVILAVLTISGILTPKETMAKLSEPTIMLFVGPFLVSAAFDKVGLTEQLGERTMRLAQKYAHSESVIILIISMATAVASILLQALGVQLVMMTLVLTLADKLRISRKRALLALGYSATIGGTFTLLGNNLNLLAKSAFEAAAPGESFGMFQMTPLTLPMGIFLIMFFCFFGMYGVKAEPREQENREAQGISSQETDRKKQLIVLAAAVLFVVFVAVDVPHMPPNVAVILMALLFGGTGVLSTKEMFASIRWEVILFAVGITTLSGAVARVGLDQVIGGFAQAVLGHSVSLRTVVAIVFFLTTAMTQIMSNSGSFAIMVPIGITLAESLNLPLKPIVIAMCLAGNSAYLTPLATPSYALLASAGGIRFGEFFRAGLPLLCFNALCAIVFVPVLFC